MRSSVLLILIEAVSAFPFLGRDVTIQPWTPAGPSDSRAPCPMMNTLANHGYLPHNGRGISAENISVALAQAINFEPQGGLFIAQQAFSRLGKVVIDLEELNAHGITEHDASLTREDFPGDSLHVNIDQLNALLADTSDSYLSVASLARSRNRVEALSPPLAANFKGQSLGEAALILMIMSQDAVPKSGTSADYESLRAPKDRVFTWLSNERLPVEAGWHGPSHPFYNTTLPLISSAIAAAQAQL